MVNSESLLDIFRSENSDKLKSDNSSITSMSDISLDSSDDSDVKSRDLSGYSSVIGDRPDVDLVKSENSESSSWYLHLSEELSTSRQHPDRLSGEQESCTSDETYISLNNSSLSFVENKCDILNDEKSSNSNMHQNTPDMFADSQGVPSCNGNSFHEPLVSKIKDKECLENAKESREEVILQDIQSSQEYYQNKSKKTSSDSEHSQSLGTPEEEASPLDLQCSQESFQHYPRADSSSSMSDPQECPLACRERHKEWSSQELSQVSQRLELRRKQAKRLILTVIRKRQMAEETLDAFKKRLKKF